MIRDITIGQYFPGSGVLHKMDARMKLVLTVAFLVLIFLCKNFLSLLVMLVLLIGMTALSKVPLRILWKSVRPILLIIALTALLNLFYVDDGTVWFHFITDITDKGVYTAIFMTIRIVCLIVASSLLTYTTSPTLLTDAMERLMSPLKKLHIEVHSIAMMMTIALRFIPTLIEEIDRIMNAQKARGADMESGNLIRRAKALVPVLIPLFVSSFRRAYELAFAMECRCYRGGDGRTRMKQMKLGLRDWLAALVMTGAFVGVIVLNHYFPAVI